MTIEPVVHRATDFNMPKDIVSVRRKELGLTQAELANRVGVVRNFISMIEIGTNRIPNDRIVPMAEALDIDPVWFLERCMLDDSRANGANNLRSIAEFIFRPENLRRALHLKGCTLSLDK